MSSQVIRTTVIRKTGQRIYRHDLSCGHSAYMPCYCRHAEAGPRRVLYEYDPKARGRYYAGEISELERQRVSEVRMLRCPTCGANKPRQAGH